MKWGFIMKIEMLLVEFELVCLIFLCIEEVGFEVYFVGGCVCDMILNLFIYDIDIVILVYLVEIK